MDILYTIFILPIETVMLFIFNNVSSFVGFGWGLVLLSIIVNIILIPIYKIAENIMEKERNLHHKMYPAVLEVKQKYSGEEGFYKLKAIYQKHNYHPIKSLRSTFGLLIQIPFFISAFIMLSNHSELSGISFMFINDLGSPDGLLWGINLLPFVMTGINLVSGYFYAKSKQEWEQTIIISAVFLLLLYVSPSALLVYWTCNNIFYLIKNYK